MGSVATDLPRSRSAAWLLAARPKTLTAALAPVLFGTALAALLGARLRWELSALALLSAMLIQIGTNLANDAIDFKKGADNETRVGPRRVTQSGIFTSGQVLTAATLCFALAMLAAVPLVLAGGWPIVVIGVVSLFLGYGYTGGPFPLAYLGLGDLFVLIFFGWIAVGGVYFLQTSAWDLPAFIAGTECGLLGTVLIAVNNLRDREGDARVGKRTLAVRLGVQGSRREIALVALLPFALNLYWLALGFRLTAILPFLVFPLATKLVRGVFHTEPGPEFNGLLAKAAALQLLFAILWSLGAALSIAWSGAGL
ncbi:MAG: 1,4-dihydroxy-2-naphthoate polyprenyltransferase [Oligoflexia bacterium]|nr:1,4-dihydroxy-2-naphthoate polyprenyltransferase [Oligoflexia bacterium]